MSAPADSCIERCRRGLFHVGVAVASGVLFLLVLLVAMLQRAWRGVCGVSRRRQDSVMVLGGGFAGCRLATLLQTQCNVTLVDRKEYFEFTPSVLRALVDPSRARRIRVPHKNFIESVRTTSVNHVEWDDEKIEVKLGDGSTHSPDYLAICLGSSYLPPFKDDQSIVAADRLESLLDSVDTLAAAVNVVVIGGGPTGVELAAEVVTTHPSKRVTLITRGKELLSRCPANAQAYALNFLRSNGCTVLLGESVSSTRNNVVKTDKGTELHFDACYLCTGIRANSEALPSGAVVRGGFVKVNSHLQVDGSANVFVAGDLAASNKEKLAQLAEAMSGVVAKNIRSLIRSKGSSISPALASYNPGPRPMLVSCGMYHGIFVFNGFALTGLVPAMAKEVVELKSLWPYVYKATLPF